jgi:hypothetical protein
MTRKFVKGEIVKILDYREKRFIGKFGEILLIAEVEPHMLPFMEYKKIYYLIKIFHKEKKKISFGRLLFRNQISHISKKIREEILAKELAEKL